MSEAKLPELFHAIADPGSAAARKAVIDLGLEEKVRFRNVHYPEVQADLSARGGKGTPAFWNGETLFEGEVPVLQQLRALAGARFNRK